MACREVVCKITDGPSKYDLLVRSLCEGHEVSFQIQGPKEVLIGQPRAQDRKLAVHISGVGKLFSEDSGLRRWHVLQGIYCDFWSFRGYITGPYERSRVRGSFWTSKRTGELVIEIEE